MQWTAALGSLCTALSVTFVWPQVVRVYRLNTVEGLSPNGTLHGLAACTLWTMYATARGVVPLIVSNAAIGMAMLLIASAQIRHRVLAVRRLMTVLASMAATGAVALSISTTLAGALAIAIGVTSILPQTLYVARATDLSGVSLPMYALVLLSTVLWSAYGALIGDWLVVTTNVLIAPCAAFVAMKAWRAQFHRLPLAADAG